MDMFKSHDYLAIIALILLFILFSIVFARCEEIENTLWKYQHTTIQNVYEYYGFANDDVYLVKENKAYQFPQTLQAWAFYSTTKNIAVMYNYHLGSWGYLISYFDKNKAIQIGVATFVIPCVWEYDLILIGDLF